MILSLSVRARFALIRSFSLTHGTAKFSISCASITGLDVQALTDELPMSDDPAIFDDLVNRTKDHNKVIFNTNSEVQTQAKRI
jgi:hypothetical protein